MQEFKLPDLGEGMHEAEIARWLVKPGDIIKLDQPMVEVETDKALVEIPSPVAGRITDIRVQAGQVAKVGEVLVVFETVTDARRSSTNDGAPSKAMASSPAASPATVSPPPPSVQVASPSPKRRALAAPAVRKLAFELGVDLEQVTPSTPNGRVTIEDVQAYVARGQAPSAPTVAAKEAQPASAAEAEAAQPSVSQPVLPEERQPLTGLRKRIAEHMEHAWRTIPHATAFDEVNGSTFTLNNIGSFGGGSGTPIINHPEVAILAVGRLQEKAIVHQGEIIVRPMMPLALSFDHRLIDGAMAGAFLSRFKALVENPQQLMLDMV